MTALLVVASIADFLLAVLLIALSGFVFGGHEGMSGDPSAVAAWAGALAACVAAAIFGFALRAYGRVAIGVAIALLPPLAALVLSSGILHPY